MIGTGALFWVALLLLRITMISVNIITITIMITTTRAGAKLRWPRARAANFARGFLFRDFKDTIFTFLQIIVWFFDNFLV